MMKYVYLLLITIPTLSIASDNINYYREDFIRQYAIFVQALESQDFNKIKEYESKNSSCGFGFGENDIDCVKNAIYEYEHCLNDMLLALKQGCKLEIGKNYLSCTAPPQWGDKSIIQVGARAKFNYDMSTKQMKIQYFICAGD